MPASPVKIGFLLGTRDYRVSGAMVSRRRAIADHGSIVFRDEPIAAFACNIEIDGQLAAEAQLKVYQAGRRSELRQPIEVRSMSRTILVTGASKGIGRAIAGASRATASASSSITISDRAGAEQTLDGHPQAAATG